MRNKGGGGGIMYRDAAHLKKYNHYKLTYYSSGFKIGGLIGIEPADIFPFKVSNYFKRRSYFITRVCTCLRTIMVLFGSYLFLHSFLSNCVFYLAVL